MTSAPGFFLLVAGAVLLCATDCARSQEKPAAVPDPPSGRTFVRPSIPAALFTPDKTGLLEPECERIASFLARYAAQKYTAAVLRGDAEAMTKGRLLLSISQHLMPMNAVAVHCATRWMDHKDPNLAPPDENLRVFSGFLLSAAKRQAAKPAPAREALARVLTRLAADIDPENEDAVYASEIQDRDGKGPPLKELLNGTLGSGW
jgi:hypothetical protein